MSSNHHGGAMDASTPAEAHHASTLPSGQDLSLPWHLRLPGGLEREFARYFRETNRIVVTVSFYILLVLFLSASTIEVLVIEGASAVTWQPRLLVLLSLIAIFVTARQPRLQPLLQPVIVILAVLFALTHNYMGVMIDHPLAFSYFYANALAILLIGTLLRVMLVWALPASLVILAAEAVSLFAFSGLALNTIVVILLFTVAAGAMSLFGQYFFERLQRRHFLSERVLSMHRTELHAANLMLETEASEDSLTGTVNRRGLEHRLEALFHGRRHGDVDTERISILLFDIDFFKQYNDTYGHQAGDECLAAVADEARSLIQRESDFIARYGGEEFLVILVDSTLQDAMVTAERIRERIEKRGFEHGSSRVADVVTVSVGVTSVGTDSVTPGELIQLADDALYHAKESGRNRVACLEPGDHKVRLL